ncbi:hypothetical protein [Paenibacillus sp. A14]|uniref:hypothetical protein n=1 Tax=Paenibacillus sp. A14 TaxID=3119820 RepID=UPI002FE04CF9
MITTELDALIAFKELRKKVQAFKQGSAVRKSNGRESRYVAIESRIGILTVVWTVIYLHFDQNSHTYMK